MIETIILPVKKNLDIPGIVLAIVLVLAVSIIQSTTAAAANVLILDNYEPGTSAGLQVGTNYLVVTMRNNKGRESGYLSKVAKVSNYPGHCKICSNA